MLEIRPKNAYKFGISRSNLITVQKKIRSKASKVKLQKGTVKRLQNSFPNIVSENFRNDNRDDNGNMIE